MHPSEPTELDELNRLLLEQIAPLPVNAGQQSAIRQTLLNRAAASIAKQAAFLTVRAQQGTWQALKPGIRFKPLWHGPQGHSVLIEFAPGTSLLPHRHQWLEEGIVLSGELQMADLYLAPLDYHVSPIGSRHAPIQSRDGAMAYLRGTSIGDHTGILMEVIGGLLPFGADHSQSVFAHGPEAWLPAGAGVEKKPLWRDAERASCFYRLAAGAKLDKLAHSLEQETMVLEGEVFMDDALLRAGDYQLAPAGSRHDEIYTDVGATLFIRGAG